MQRPYRMPQSLSGPLGDGRLRMLVLGGALWAVLVGMVFMLDPVRIVGTTVAGLVGLALLMRPRLAVLAFLGLRLVFDLLWWAGGVGFGLNVMEFYSMCATLGAVAILLMNLPNVQRHPVFPFFLLYAAVVAVATVRVPTLLGIAAAAKLISPFFVLLLASLFFTSRREVNRLLWVFLIVGSMPVAYSLVSIAAGTNFETKGGIDRLVGAYMNPTHHALTMAFLASVGLFVAYQNGRTSKGYLAGLLTLGAVVSLYYSFTRAPQLAFVIFTGVFLYLERRYRYLLAMVVGLALVFTYSELTQTRFFELSDNLFGSSVLRDRSAELGSGRGELWRVSMAFYLDRPPYDLLLGMGMGMEYAHPLQKDPHNDYLMLLYQAGPLAVVAYVSTLWLSLREGLRVHRAAREVWLRQLAAFTVGVCVAVIVTDAMTNAWLSRTSPAWYTMAVLGMAFGPRSLVSRPGAARGAAVDPGEGQRPPARSS